jgi:nitronate monooxygenase
MQDGDMDAGAWSCGMVVGLMTSTCQELIDTIMADMSHHPQAADGFDA